MKRKESVRQESTISIIFIVAALCCQVLMVGSAHAEWKWVHGNSGMIQHVDRLDMPRQTATQTMWIPVEQAGINSHAPGISWCPPGWYIVALDLNSDPLISAMDSPVIGQVLCAKETEPTYRLGWGLDFMHQYGKVNWIHYSIPAPGNKRVAHVGLRFQTNNDLSKITAVHVWDADVKIKQFQGPWSGPKKDIVLDFGTPIECTYGLGISVGIEATPAVMDPLQIIHKFQIFSAGANFVD
jgi:hypothetical protein